MHQCKDVNIIAQTIQMCVSLNTVFVFRTTSTKEENWCCYFLFSFNFKKTKKTKLQNKNQQANNQTLNILCPHNFPKKLQTLDSSQRSLLLF